MVLFGEPSDRARPVFKSQAASSEVAFFVPESQPGADGLLLPRLAYTPMDGRFGRAPRLKYLPAQIRSILKGVVGEDAAQKIKPAQQQTRKSYYERRLELVRELRRAGVPLPAGTDYAPYPLLFPGSSLHDELVKLVEAGLTPLEALRTATINSARFLRMNGPLGTIAAGKRADLVPLDADPLTGIANTRRINSVVADGRYFPPAEVERFLAGVAAAKTG